jgi:chromosome segregation ATPase
MMSQDPTAPDALRLVAIALEDCNALISTLITAKAEYEKERARHADALIDLGVKHAAALHVKDQERAVVQAKLDDCDRAFSLERGKLILAETRARDHERRAEELNAAFAEKMNEVLRLEGELFSQRNHADMLGMRITELESGKRAAEQRTRAAHELLRECLDGGLLPPEVEQRISAMLKGGGR